MAELVQNPYPVFMDIDGTSLDDGYIFIGEPGKDPELFPLQAYWDVGLTVPANNIRTKGGYPVNGTFPNRLYTSGPYSILVKNKREIIVYAQQDSFIPVIADAATLTGASLSTDGTFAANSDALIPSQKATKTYSDNLNIINDTTITDAVDVSTELPLPADIVGVMTFTRSGAGTGKRILTVPTGESVDWGDAIVLNGSIVLEGTGKVVVRASGGNIKVDVYEDYGQASDSGIHNNRLWEKDIKNMRISGAYLGTLTTSISIPMHKTFVSNLKLTMGASSIPFSIASNTLQMFTTDLINITIVWDADGGANQVTWWAEGPWR